MADIRALELYSGVGGFHCAFRECGLPGCVVAAVDVNTAANETYKHNFFETKLLQRNIQSLTVDEIEELNVNFIWMSPPCQPFTRVGKKKDCLDSRTSSFLYVLDLIARLKTKPQYIGLENVKGFETSDARNNFVSMLEENGYTFQEFLLTAQQFGVPNSRLRYYAIAKLKPLTFPFQTTGEVMLDLPGCSEVALLPLKNFLESSNPEKSSHLEDRLLTDKTLSKYALILDIVNTDSTNSCCFTKAYGHYVEGTGSVIHQNMDVAVIKRKLNRQHILLDNAFAIAADITTADDDDDDRAQRKLDALRSLKLRYFTPKEVGRLLGFPEDFGFPVQTTVRQQYRLLGNSLNVKVVSCLLTGCFKHSFT